MNDRANAESVPNAPIPSPPADLDHEQVRAPQHVDVTEAARILGMSQRVAHALVRSGRLKSENLGTRNMIPRSELEAFPERESDDGG